MFSVKCVCMSGPFSEGEGIIEDEPIGQEPLTTITGPSQVSSTVKALSLALTISVFQLRTKFGVLGVSTPSSDLRSTLSGTVRAQPLNDMYMRFHAIYRHHNRLA